MHLVRDPRTFPIGGLTKGKTVANELFRQRQVGTVGQKV